MKTLDKEQEPVDFLKYYVKPHKNISREVTDTDIEKVITDAHIMYNLCFTKAGLHNGAHAIAHSQINDKDPLQFFVTAYQEIIINPEILRFIKYTEEKIEGCMTYCDKHPLKIQRWRKGEVEFQTITKGGKLSERIKKEIKNIEAQVFQHEIDHFRGKYIYD